MTARLVTLAWLIGLLGAAGLGQTAPATAPPASQPASAPVSQPGSIKVLFIGNSYTGFGDMTTMVERISQEVAPAKPIKAQQISPGGYTFEEHWNVAERAMKYAKVDGVVRNDTLNAIRKGGWDVIVLQAYVDVVGQPENFQKYGRLLAEEAKKSGARVVFYQTWPYKKPTIPWPEMLAKYNDQYFSLAKATGAAVSPVGIAFELIKTRKPEMGTTIHYGGGDEHPSRIGSWLIACMHVATIYDRSPVGMPSELYRNEGEKRAARPLVKVEPEVAAFLQQTAADAIAEARKLAASAPSSAPSTTASGR